MKIAFFDTKPYDSNSFNSMNQNFGLEIKYYEQRLNVDTAVMADGYEVVCAFVNDIVDAAVIETLYKGGTRLLALRCAGYNNVDFKAAYGKIHVVRVPAYSPYAVAEHAVALMMTLNRKTHRAYVRTRENNFSINGLLGFDFFEKTVGIIGTGKIGQIFANICKGFGMRVLAYDLFQNASLDIEYSDLDHIYAQADIISLHCPLTPQTHHMINHESIKKMKDGVMLINTSRGGLINTEALVDGLKSHKIGWAGLDVYEEEAEYFFEDFSGEIVSDDVLARLLSFTNVLVTSHQAFFTKEALSNIARTTLDNILSYINGDILNNEICYQCEKGKVECTKQSNNKCF